MQCNFQLKLNSNIISQDIFLRVVEHLMCSVSQISYTEGRALQNPREEIVLVVHSDTTLASLSACPANF